MHTGVREETREKIAHVRAGRGLSLLGGDGGGCPRCNTDRPR